MSVPHFQLYFFSPKPRFYFCELLWFWKWRRFLNFYPMKTISSRKSEVESQVGYSQIRNELIETSPTSHRNLCFRVANSEIQLRAQNSLSGSAARLTGRKTLHWGCLGPQGGCWGPVLPFSSCRLGHFWPIGDPRHWPFWIWGFYSKAAFVAWWLTIAG